MLQLESTKLPFDTPDQVEGGGEGIITLFCFSVLDQFIGKLIQYLFILY